MGNTGLGILYLLFFWTFIPSTVTLIELFLLSDRVKNYKNAKAIEIASGVKAMFPQKQIIPTRCFAVHGSILILAEKTYHRPAVPLRMEKQA